LAVRDLAIRNRLTARSSQRIRLRLAASFRHRLCKIGEQHREPQPKRDLQIEPERRVRMDDQQYSRDDASHFNHEHHWIAHHCARA
jgi:hypothetical protein